MKAGVLLHPGLLQVLASAGHTDEFLICDAGFPALGFPADDVAHVSLKRRAHGSRAIVRTGEYTPYANVILSMGVAF